jgi:hypothetical protein
MTTMPWQGAACGWWALGELSAACSGAAEDLKLATEASALLERLGRAVAAASAGMTLRQLAEVTWGQDILLPCRLVCGIARTFAQQSSCWQVQL